MTGNEHTLVLGGGGVAGIAWEIGLLAGLSHHGLDLHHAASILGTSAGSTVGAQISGRMSLEELYARQLAGVAYEVSKSFTGMNMVRFLLASALPGSQESAARRIGRLALGAKVGSVEERRSVIQMRLPSHEWPDADLRLVVVDAGTGAARILTRDDGINLVDAVAASCAVPMVWPPVEFRGRFYIDGGSRSPVNLDLAAGAGAVIALAPMTLSFKRAGSISAQRQALRGRNIAIITPSPEAKRAKGRNPLDKSVVPVVAKAGWDQAPRELNRISSALQSVS